MIDLITNNLDAIRKACEDHDVKALWVFGSAVNGTWVEGKSDVDFLVDTGDSNEDLFSRYKGLYVDLEKLLGVPIDTTRIQQVQSAWLKQEPADTKVLIYDAEAASVSI